MKNMTIRGIVFALISHCITKQYGSKASKGIERSRIVELAQNQCNINAELIEKAFNWLDSEGYIKLHKQSVTIRKAGWELADRYIKSFKRWYKQRNTSETAK